MITIDRFANDINRVKPRQKAQLATVVEVSELGVKIRVDGEGEIREKYYNSLAQVGVGDRVFIQYYSGTILIIGKLLY